MECLEPIYPNYDAIALESCREWSDNLPLDSVVAMDGSWSQRRNARHCILDFIDANSGKVVDFEILGNRSVLRMAMISTLQIAWQLRVFDGLSVNGTRIRL
jgi:hypothetical protein